MLYSLWTYACYSAVRLLVLVIASSFVTSVNLNLFFLQCLLAAFLLALMLIISVLAERLAGKSVSDVTCLESSRTLNLNSVSFQLPNFFCEIDLNKILMVSELNKKKSIVVVFSIITVVGLLYCMWFVA